MGETRTLFGPSDARAKPGAVRRSNRASQDGEGIQLVSNPLATPGMS